MDGDENSIQEFFDQSQEKPSKSKVEPALDIFKMLPCTATKEMKCKVLPSNSKSCITLND